MKSFREVALACAVLTWTTSPAFAAGDVERGADVFDGQCAECHSVKAGKNKKGPTLFGVLDRKAGSVPKYDYSDGMKQVDFAWDSQHLAAYVKQPKQVVPGGKMKFNEKLSSQEIEDLLAFLSTLD